MSTERDDGGPVFPTPYPRPDPNNISKALQADGMSLRDWFAGQALMGIIRNGVIDGFEPEVAARAYRFADALLAERDA